MLLTTRSTSAVVGCEALKCNEPLLSAPVKPGPNVLLLYPPLLLLPPRGINQMLQAPDSGNWTSNSRPSSGERGIQASCCQFHMHIAVKFANSNVLYCAHSLSVSAMAKREQTSCSPPVDVQCMVDLKHMAGCYHCQQKRLLHQCCIAKHYASFPSKQKHKLYGCCCSTLELISQRGTAIIINGVAQPPTNAFQ